MSNDENSNQLDYKDTYKYRFDFILKAIDDTQNAIRFTDTKAGAVIGFWSIIFTLLTKFSGNWFSLLTISSPIEQSIVYLLIFFMFCFFIKSFWLAYKVLVPRSNPTDHIDKSGVTDNGLFFLNEMKPNISGKYLYNEYQQLKLGMSTKDYITKLEKLNGKQLHTELIIELQKISFIRNVKIARVNKAISSILNFMTTFFILSLLLLSYKFHFIGGKTLFSIHINVQLFIVLYISHKIGDYLLQTNKQANFKSKEWVTLITHCLVYTVITLGLAYILTGYVNTFALLLVFFSHILLDKGTFINWWAVNLKRIENPNEPIVQTTMMELDQTFHYIILFIVSCIH